MRALGLSGAAPGRKPRATGPAEGDRAPLACCAATSPPPPARTADGWSTCALVPTRSGYSLHGVRHGPVRPPHRRLGHQRAHGHRQRGQRPGAGDLAAQAPRRRRPRGPGPPQRPRISVPVHRLHPTTRRRGHRGIGRSRGFLLRQRRRRSPQQVLQTRTRLARRPLEGTRRPRQPRPPDGWTGTTAPDPTAPTPTTSHPPPSNTATIATTPPPPPRHPPRHNQPSTKPRTIHCPSRPSSHSLCSQGRTRSSLSPTSSPHTLGRRSSCASPGCSSPRRLSVLRGCGRGVSG